jgi:methionyl-tRNA formyltransferase
LDSQNIRIWNSSFEEGNHNFGIGEICSHKDKKIGVACANGIVFLEKIQMPGKKALESHEILNSKKEFFAIGKVFEH